VRTLDGFAKQPFTDPERIFPKGSRAFAGTFAEGIFRSEAKSADLDRGLTETRSFFERNEDDPEWMGGQVNIFFAGHGANNNAASAANWGALFLKDTVITPEDLQKRLVSTLPKSVLQHWHDPTKYGNCRVDMYLDCCYSAQFVAAFIGRLFNDRNGLVPGKFWCSSMPFQESFEIDKVEQGLFTYYLMVEYTMKRRPGWLRALLQRREPSLWGGHVGRHTENRQNPVLIDFADVQDINIAIPGADPQDRYRDSQRCADESIQRGGDLALWFNEYLQVVYKENSRNCGNGGQARNMTEN